MRFLRITDDATPDELAEAAYNLRAKQERVKDPVVKAELSAAIDELLDLYSARLIVRR